MYNNTSTTAVRRNLRKPTPTTPVFMQKSINSTEAIELLNQFVSEVRKEFRKRDKLTVKGCLVKSDCQQLTFANSEVSITIDFEGGIQL